MISYNLKKWNIAFFINIIYSSLYILHLYIIKYDFYNKKSKKK